MTTKCFKVSLEINKDTVHESLVIRNIIFLIVTFLFFQGAKTNHNDIMEKFTASLKISLYINILNIHLELGFEFGPLRIRYLFSSSRV